MRIWKRGIPLLLLAMLTIAVATGCEGATAQIGGSEEEEIHYADQDFIKDLGKGLEARWTLNEKYDAEDGDTVNVEHRKEYIQAEIDAISKYENETFEDSVLKEKVLSYINALKQSQEALKYANADFERYATEWEKAYNQRAKLLEDFVSDYELTVSDKYQSILDDFMVTSQITKESEALEDALDQMAKGITFEMVSNEYGYKTYNAIVENTTGKDLGNTQFTINLLDADGVIVETTYYSVDNYKAGQKAKVEIYTDKDFASTEVTIDTF